MAFERFYILEFYRIDYVTCREQNVTGEELLVEFVVVLVAKINYFLGYFRTWIFPKHTSKIVGDKTKPALEQSLFVPYRHIRSVYAVSFKEYFSWLHLSDIGINLSSRISVSAVNIVDIKGLKL